MRHAQNVQAEKASGQDSLFGGGADSDLALAKPPLPTGKDWDHLDRLSNEFSAVGFFLSAHPLDGLEVQLDRLHVVSSVNLEEKLQTQLAARVQMAGILLKKQEKISARSGKKYAFLQVSDTGGVFEVMVFSEALAQARDILVEGHALLLTVDAEIKDDQLRLVGQMVMDLDSALSQSIQTCEIRLKSMEEFEGLKAILESEQGQGPACLHLIVPAEQGRYGKIRLAGRWNFSGAVRRAVQNVEAVDAIVDI